MSARGKRTPRRPELSQHFLRSEALARGLVAQTRFSEDDLVVEIGAGRGILTAALADRGATVRAVELDPRLCEHLRRRFRSEPHVTVVEADFLRVGLPEAPYAILGNVPFNRTAAIMRRLVDGLRPPTDAWLILQREAAQRFAGAPHAPESLPSLLLKPAWHVEIVRQLRPSDFDPPPGVDTVVLWLARRTRPLVHEAERETYGRFVRSCFGQGGNTVVRCLRSSFTRVEIRRLGADLRFRLDAPPSHLTFGQWLGLFRFHALRRRGF